MYNSLFYYSFCLSSKYKTNDLFSQYRVYNFDIERFVIPAKKGDAYAAVELGNKITAFNNSWGKDCLRIFVYSGHGYAPPGQSGYLIA